MIHEYFNTIRLVYDSLGYEEILSPAPNEYGSFEDLTTRAIHRREMIISLTNDALRLATIDFIISCPKSLWESYNCPKSLLFKRAIREGADELLGNKVASIITGLWRYYGGFEVFEILRRHYSIDTDNLILKRHQ